MISFKISRFLQVALYAVAGVLLTNYARLQFANVQADVQADVQAQATPVSEFTVVLAETSISPTGEGRITSLQTWATRRDGSVVLKLGPDGLGSRRIQYANGIVVETNDVTRAKSTTRRPTVFARRLPAASCASGRADEGEPSVEVLGSARAAKFVRSDGTRSTSVWYALDYGCALVRRVITFEDGSSSEMRVVSLASDPPNPKLFDIPKDYREGPPSSLRTEEERKACDDGCAQRFKRFDDEYQGLRVK